MKPIHLCSNQSRVIRQGHIVDRSFPGTSRVRLMSGGSCVCSMTPAPDVSHPVQANISLVFLASMYQGPSYPCKAGFALFDRHKHHVLGEDCYDHHVREYDNVYSADVNNLEFWVWEDVNSITRAWIYFSGLYTLNSTCLPILTRKCILY